MNQQADVMGAVQFMRQKAQQAGNLKTTPQQTVTDQGSNVIIQPADPQVVYVPDYDPELAYGYPVGLWPGFYPWWGVGGPYLSFGIGFGIGPFFGFGWGWGGWGFDWGRRGLLFGGRPYGFQSHAFYDRNAYFHGNYRGYAAPYARGSRTARGYRGTSGQRKCEGYTLRRLWRSHPRWRRTRLFFARNVQHAAAAVAAVAMPVAVAMAAATGAN